MNCIESLTSHIIRYQLNQMEQDYSYLFRERTRRWHAINVFLEENRRYFLLQRFGSERTLSAENKILAPKSLHVGKFYVYIKNSFNAVLCTRSMVIQIICISPFFILQKLFYFFIE